MAEIFERATLAGMELENRLVRSATWEGLADSRRRNHARSWCGSTRIWRTAVSV